MKLHPETGLHYIVSFPPRARAFFDIITAYRAFAATNEWLTCINHTELEGRMAGISVNPRYFVVLWGVQAPTPPPDRKALFARVYSEALDADHGNMLGVHVKWLGITQAQIAAMDAAFGHTPWMAEQLGGHILPCGWDPGVMGTPLREEPKLHRYTYLGAMAGKRAWLCPAMAEALGDAYTDASGQWQRRALHTLNASSGYLYLTHSDVHSFSTPRIWQAVATSAAMVTERGRDCWPMEEDHYITLPTLTPDNVVETAGYLSDLSDEHLAATSVRLHEALHHFTLDHVVDHYLIPASVKIQNAR
jgi:hypothetical protein